MMTALSSNTTSAQRKFPERIGLSHGSGGRDMQLLLNELIIPALGLSANDMQDDQAKWLLPQLSAQGDRLAFTTDSYTVDPLFFPGGDIGSLAVNGTVNDLAVGGATPQMLSCALMIEEGFPSEDLRRVLESMRAAADKASVRIVTGDTKVVHQGSVDGLFINTSAVGVIPQGCDLAANKLQPGDQIIVSGPVGDHGAAILGARGDLHLEVPVQSDCACISRQAQALVQQCRHLKAMRDATRGGLAAVLNEFAQASDCGIRIEELSVPVRPPVAAACEILGLDPMHLANEGTFVAVVPEVELNQALDALNAAIESGQACRIGEVVDAQPSVVTMNSRFGSERVIDMPAGELLPRIC